MSQRRYSAAQLRRDVIVAGLIIAALASAALWSWRETATTPSTASPPIANGAEETPAQAAAPSTGMATDVPPAAAPPVVAQPPDDATPEALDTGLADADAALATDRLLGDQGAGERYLFVLASAHPEAVDLRQQAFAGLRATLIALSRRERVERPQRWLALLSAIAARGDIDNDLRDRAAALQTRAETELTIRSLAQAAQQPEQTLSAIRARWDTLNAALQAQQLEAHPEHSATREHLVQALLVRATAQAEQKALSQAIETLHTATHIAPSDQRISTALELRQRELAGEIARIELDFEAALETDNLVAAEAAKLAMRPFSIPAAALLTERLADFRRYGGFQPGERFFDTMTDHDFTGPSMQVIEVGSFAMGADDDDEMASNSERPQHRVSIARGFALAEHETSVEDFRRFVTVSGYRTTAQRSGFTSIYNPRTGRLTRGRGRDWRHDYVGAVAASDLPVVHVSHEDADAYTRWLSDQTGYNYRLPSEAEFAYALRAGTDSRYWWGEDSPSERVENLTGERDQGPRRQRWENGFDDYDDGFWGPAPVASFARNPFNLFDIGGNVAEWTADCWHDNYRRAPADGRPWVNRGCAEGVVRGGSWGSSPSRTRSSARNRTAMDATSPQIGFRVARDL